jgi:hypothetical protein
VTFDATPPFTSAPSLDLSACEHMTVCDLSGVERFLVWAVRWSASLHDDSEFAELCLRDSFERAGLVSCLPSFRRFVAMVHGEPAPCPPAARLGCWRINTVEALTLHAIACLEQQPCSAHLVAEGAALSFRRTGAPRGYGSCGSRTDSA